LPQLLATGLKIVAQRDAEVALRLPGREKLCPSQWLGALDGGVGAQRDALALGCAELGIAGPLHGPNSLLEGHAEVLHSLSMDAGVIRMLV
jgi:hypothetical protein